eukprot:TRINITY_DN9780_c0_g1_i1.p1 TRINITY_DN9780_c0_g1~~TRINITY_DN9780_c0_g1_i1.p1  ORF type:complete len:739 (+),score=164.61 TRINITY_DN9780_c0_g1_i1:97-2313(+)
MLSSETRASEVSGGSVSKGSGDEECTTANSGSSRLSRPTANIAKYVARASREKKSSIFDLTDHLESERDYGTPPDQSSMCIIPSSDPTVSNDPVILEAAFLKHQHPADLSPPKPSEIKNFISGDSKVLVLYASGSVGLQKDETNSYRPCKGNLLQTIKSFPMLYDKGSWSKDDGVLSTPPSYYGKRVHYELKEMDPIIDSACMDMHDWVKLAHEVADEYDKYDGFVILHGTDTMTYTAAALSFMLEHIGKTVIFTGGLVPLCEPRNDSLNNLLDAITIAGHFVIPEVCICYGGKLMRGCRAVKKSSSDSNSLFDSPNCGILGKATLNIDIDWRGVRQPNSMSRLKLHTALCPDVAVLHLFPGITISAVKAVLQPPVRGVVLRTFGSGTAPSVRHDILQALKNAASRGIVIISVSQCMEGTVSLEMGRALMRVGVVPGVDMTVECALVKLSFLLGVCKNGSTETVSKLLTQDLRGELTVSVADRFNAGSDEFLSKLSSAMDVSSEGEGEDLRDYLNSIVMCNAAQSGDLSSMKMLVESEAGWQVDVQDYDSRTPLHIAAASGHSHVAEYLITKGARVHHKDRQGHTPLVQAVLCGNAETAATISQAGGVLGLVNSKVHEYINQAIISKDPAQVQLFLTYGADLEPADFSKAPPLHLAVQQGNLEIVKLLINSGKCDLNNRDWWGYTPVDIAREAQSRSPEPGCYIYEAICDLLQQTLASQDDTNIAGLEIEMAGDTIDT